MEWMRARISEAGLKKTHGVSKRRDLDGGRQEGIVPRTV